MPVVHFDLDTLAVPPPGYARLAEFAGDLQTRIDEVEAVELVGHSERLGTPEERARLSRGRAEAVRDVLLGLGVSPQLIRTRSASDLEPQVETAAGVREPMNRRVEIRLILTAEAVAAAAARRDSAIAGGLPVPTC